MSDDLMIVNYKVLVTKPNNIDKMYLCKIL